MAIAFRWAHTWHGEGNTWAVLQHVEGLVNVPVLRQLTGHGVAVRIVGCQRVSSANGRLCNARLIPTGLMLRQSAGGDNYGRQVVSETDNCR